MYEVSFDLVVKLKMPSPSTAFEISSQVVDFSSPGVGKNGQGWKTG